MTALNSQLKRRRCTNGIHARHFRLSACNSKGKEALSAGGSKRASPESSRQSTYDIHDLAFESPLDFTFLMSFSYLVAFVWSTYICLINTQKPTL